MYSKLLITAALVPAFLFIFTACSSTPSQPAVGATPAEEVPAVTIPEQEVTPPDTTAIIRHKGSEAGLDILPVWVEAYLNGGTEAVESLPDFAETVCYITEVSAPTLEEGYNLALSELPVPGARQVSGWWMLVHRADAAEDYFTVYVLYTIPRDTRDRHTAVN